MTTCQPGPGHRFSFEEKFLWPSFSQRCGRCHLSRGPLCHIHSGRLFLPSDWQYWCRFPFPHVKDSRSRSCCRIDPCPWTGPSQPQRQGMISALSYHNITTHVPHAVSIAAPRDSRIPSLDYPPNSSPSFRGWSLQRRDRTSYHRWCIHKDLQSGENIVRLL